MLPDSEQMVIEGTGRFINRKTKTSGETYDRFFIYVPTELGRDGTFPFKESDTVLIRIDARNKRLVIEKADVKDINERKK